MEQFWEEMWNREERFLSSADSGFRHGVPFVSVSALSGQFYCEYKVENEFELGEIPTLAKENGTELHDELIPGTEVSAEEFVGLVSGEGPSYAVLRVWGSVGGLKLVGMPDHIVWSRGKPLWVVELKTTKGDPTPLWADQENQVRIYGLLLDLMGLDCSKLKLAVVRVKASELLEEDRRLWMVRVSRALMRGEVARLEAESRGATKVHVILHERKAALDAILSKAGYWTGAREPKPSTSVGKCRACEYSRVCPKSLARL